MANWKDIKTWKPGTRFTEEGMACVLLEINENGVWYAYKYPSGYWESDGFDKDNNALETWKLLEEKPTQKENDLSGVKVGDKLWSVEFGWGEVTGKDSDKDFAIEIDFGAEENSYTLKGLRYFDYLPTLFWNEVHFDYPALPKDRQKVKVECEGKEYFVTRDKFSEIIKGDENEL